MCSLFRQNTYKFAIFMVKENPSMYVFFLFFIFHLEQLWILPYKCPGLCWHRLGHLKGKTPKSSKWKTKLVIFHKYGKFWSVLLEQKVERKPPFSEERCFVLICYLYDLYLQCLYCLLLGTMNIVKHFYCITKIVVVTIFLQ